MLVFSCRFFLAVDVAAFFVARPFLRFIGTVDECGQAVVVRGFTVVMLDIIVVYCCLDAVACARVGAFIVVALTASTAVVTAMRR